MLKNLEVIHGSQKSFGGKAKVEEKGNRISLYSYGTFICSTRDGDIVDFSRNRDHYSATTMRHLNEFLLQNGGQKHTRKEWFEVIGLA